MTTPDQRAAVAPPPDGFALEVETLIIGAGAAGMTAALAASDDGETPLVLERDPAPSGSTALSAGLIPAAGTRFQRLLGIEDDPERFAADIQRKAEGQNDPAFVRRIAETAAATVEWLADAHGLPFSLVDNFDYPGHTRRRMHGLPSRSGLELVGRLREACETAGVEIICNAAATTLFAEGGRIHGVEVSRPDGSKEQIGCGRLILACNGFGGDQAKVRRHMPEIAEALWFGHDGNKGEALDWSEALGAVTRHLGAYQGHGNVAHPHGILITWATMTEGGVQVNAHGERFWDESRGYSEAARIVLSQPGGQAFAIFDQRIAEIAGQFDDFRQAKAQGAIKTAASPEALAEALGLSGETLARTLAAIPTDETPDPFGRVFTGPPLTPPLMGVRVTGALFHTQGGLVLNAAAQALHPDGAPFPNLHAAGGAAVGISGSGDSGYLSGNGLLCAVVLGRAAGRAG